ncbi:DUF1573 domain-containing protein [Candidatus Parcubacteria bacterium]|nr:MAG: DUF1573 domain-containing protein [Candidatus Parcubacteria bacterium]
MKNIYIILISVIILGGIAGYGYYQAGVWGQNGEPEIYGPKISIEPAKFDLGTVIYGEVAKKNFLLTNIGTENLEILRLSTSCGCTKAAMADDKMTIAPGETAELIVTFDPAVHKDDTDIGEIQRIVYVKSNDAQNPEMEIELSATVIKNNN